MENFGDWLRSELDSRGLSQKDLADRSGITPAQISRIISGTRGVGEESLLAIARALKLRPEEVFRAAGFLPQTHEENPMAKEAAYLVGILSDARKRQAVDYIRYLVQLEESENR